MARPYESPLRREQAAATRRQILQAAQRLFERQGYAATTIAQIAAEAGVSVKTVYVAFDTKSGVLNWLRRYHFQHHFATNRQFGVSTPIWDYVFRTGR